MNSLDQTSRETFYIRYDVGGKPTWFPISDTMTVIRDCQDTKDEDAVPASDGRPLEKP